MWTPGTIWGNYGDEKVTTTDLANGNPLGTRMVLPDGRVFYYAQSNGAVGAGLLAQAAVGVANHDMDLVIATAAAVGARLVNLTLQNTAVTLDQYRDGYLYINDGAGEGHTYKVEGHAVIAGNGTGDILLREPIAEAIGTSALAGLVRNPYAEVIVNPTSTTGQVVGVFAAEFADNAFGWLQTWGPAAVLCDVAFVLGTHVRVSDSQPGAGEPLNRDGTDEDDENIGVAMLIAPESTDYGMVDLRIRP